MARRLLTNLRLLDPERPLDDGDSWSLLVEGGRIRERLHEAGGASVADAERVDLGGALLAPGFLDLHLHGEPIFARDDAIRDAVAHLAASCLRHGTTGFLLTTVAWERERLTRFVTQAVRSMTQGERSGASAALLGLHLEGPWISAAAAGAQPAAAIRPYRDPEGRDLLDRAEGAVRMVTLAPEAEGAARLLDELARRGAIAAAGHTLASAAALTQAVDAGLTHVTHLFNAMGRLHHREPGVAGHALADDRLTCDLICDGAHVSPELVRVAARAKGERLVLISDRVEPPAPAPGPAFAEPGATSTLPDFGAGPVRDDGTALRLPDGTLAGSTLTLDRALRNASAWAGLALHEAVAACTLRPARLLGLEGERGTLRPGARADFAVLDDRGALLETWLGGEAVYRSPRATP